MKKRIVSVILAGISAAGLFATSAYADDPLVISAGTASVRTGDGFTLGTSFTVGAQDEIVTALGVWDGPNSGGGGSVGDGLQFSKPIEIWDDAGNPVTSATVPSGTSGTLVGEFRYASVTPVKLLAGQTYTLGAYYRVPSLDTLRNNSNTPTFSSDFTSYVARFTGSNSVGSISQPTGGAGLGAYVGPNVLYTTLVVSNTNDSGPGSLRQAILNANSSPTAAAAFPITFNIPGTDPGCSNGVCTITLTTDQLAFGADVTITGPGASQLIVQRSTDPATPKFRIFNNGGFNVSLSGITISNGSAPFSDPNNRDGGGIQSNGGTLVVSDCVITGNSAGAYGGGIITANGHMTIVNSTISGNYAGSGGGGIFSDDFELNKSTVTGNSADGDGGGVYNFGTMTAVNSTISGNTAISHGGGLFVNGSVSTLTSVTITNNDSDSDNSGGETGGGVFVTLGTPLLRNTIVAGNHRVNNTGPADDIQNSNVDPTSSYNLIGTGGSGGLTNGVNQNIVGVDPKLGALANNGGPTLTHLPQQGSPAIDQGKAFGSTTDQRGLTRPVRFDNTKPGVSGGDYSDIGAVELQQSFCTPAPAGIAGWWTGDGNTTDIVGGNNGTFNGTTAYGTGEVGPAFSFDGASFVTTNLDVQPSAMPSTTWEAWIYPTSVSSPTRQTIFADDDGGYDRGLVIESGGPTFAVFTGDSGTGRSYPVTADVNQWQHVAVVYDQGGNVTFYKNGVAYGPYATSGQSTANNFAIGGSPLNGGSQFFNGLIDEVQVYNTALSASDIQSTYNAGPGGNCKSCLNPPANLISWWPGQNNANDVVGTNHGTLQGGATYDSGKIGQAFTFSNNGDAIVVPHNSSQNPGAQLTVDAWIFPKSVLESSGNSDASIINKRTPGNDRGYTLEIDNNNTTNGLRFEIQTDQGLFAMLVPNATVPDVWQHVAATYDGFTMTIFVNGVSVGSPVSASGTVTPVTNDLLIGQNIVNGESFPGLIDEVELFSRGLSPDEVQSIYAAGLHAPVSVSDFSNVGKCVPAPSVQLSSATYSVLETANNVTITVTRTGDSSVTSTVDYATSDGTGTAGIDYTSTSGTLTFNPGDVSQTFQVPILDDNVQGPDETFTVALSNPSAGASVGLASATVTIQEVADNDPPNAVTNTNDSGPGSLRQAIIEAQAGDTINFNIAGGGPHTITLTSGLGISTDITIAGPGADLLTVQRDPNAGNFSVFQNGATATISGMRISGGTGSDPNGFGVTAGGGIYNQGTLTLNNVTVTDNHVTGGGGGIFNAPIGPAVLTLSGCTVSGNTASISGGGIRNAGATLTVTGSTISGNGCGSQGGGIQNNTGAGFTVSNSTLSGNTSNQGGAIYNDSGLRLVNSTLSGNGCSGSGGGLYNGRLSTSGSATLINVTVTNNRSDNDNSGGEQGGGIFRSANTSVALFNTIVAGNFRGTGATRDDVSGDINAASSFNLIGDGTNMTGITNGSNGSQVGSSASPIDPKLKPLGSYGGPTQTHLLLLGSPAVNAGDNSEITNPPFDGPPFTDQRGSGFPRIVNTTVDIGAVEVNYSVAPTTGSGQDTVITDAFGTQLQATVTESGNLMSGLNVTFTAPAGGASGTFQGSNNSVVEITNAGGVATAPVFTANATAGGPYNVAASLDGGVASANFSLTNDKASSSTTVTVSNATYDGNPHGATATVTGIAGLNHSVSSITYTGRNATTYNSATAPTNVGDYTATATYSGDANHNGSSDSKDYSISKASSTTAVTVSDAIFDGNPHGGSATATGAGGLSQSVTITYSGRNSTNYGPASTPPTNGGDYTASATFAGDANHTGSTNSKDFSIAKADSTTSVTVSDTTYDGQPHGGSALVTGAGGLNQSLPVTYTGRNSTTYSSTTPPTDAGDYTASASYTDSTGNYTNSSGSKDFSITKAVTNVAVTATPNPGTDGQAISFKATVSSAAGGTMSGTVQFTDNGTNIGTPQSLAANRTASFGASLSPGTHSIGAIYSGDNNFAGSTGSLSGGELVNPSPTPTPTATPAATPTATPTPTPSATPATAEPLNISTRMEVLSGDNVLIAGFIITGQPNATKKVMIRGLGPSLAAAGVPNPLSDPLLELHGPAGFTTIVNDNWADAPNASEIPDGFQPSDPRESVIIATLTIGSQGYANYTAIVRGATGETGIGLVEAYDLEAGTNQFANISTRGFIDKGDNVMIGGFILGASSAGSKVLILGKGPSLADQGVSGVLADPTLELHDSQGTKIRSNDNWKVDDATGQSQEAAITATTVAPSNDLESAILDTFPPGAYTAIVAGNDQATGIGLVEVYNLK